MNDLIYLGVVIRYGCWVYERGGKSCGACKKIGGEINILIKEKSLREYAVRGFYEGMLTPTLLVLYDGETLT